ncbi:LOW QUALITY PROTEIN: hypothetical protein HID58_011739, partial [Brassica napus]
VSLDESRSHPSPIVTITEKKTFAGTVTFNLDQASNFLRRRHHQTTPTNVNSTKKKEKQLNPKKLTEGTGRRRGKAWSTFTPQLNVASTSRGPEPATTELTEPPSPGDKTKQPQKAFHRTFLTTTAPLQQNQIHETTFFHSSGKAEEGGDVSKAKIEDFFGGAPVTARAHTRRPITGPEDGSAFLLSLLSLKLA